MTSRDMRLTVGKISKALLWVVYVWVVLNLVLLFLAFLLRLFGANPDAEFTQWVYRSVQRSMAPFRGIFEPIELSDQSVLDTSLLFAMIIYGLAALFLRAGIDWVSWRVEQRRGLVEQEAWAAAGVDAPSAAGGAATGGGPPPLNTPQQTIAPRVVVPPAPADPFDRPPGP